MGIFSRKDKGSKVENKKDDPAFEVPPAANNESLATSLHGEVNNPGENEERKYTVKDYALRDYWKDAKYYNLGRDVLKAQLKRICQDAEFSELDVATLYGLLMYKEQNIDMLNNDEKKMKYMKDIEGFMEIFEKIENDAIKKAKQFQYKEELAGDFVGVEGVEKAINGVYQAHIEKQDEEQSR